MKYLELLRKQYNDKIAERDAAKEAHDAVLDAAADEERTTLTADETKAQDEYRTKIAELDTELDALEPRIKELEKVGERAALAAPAPTFIRKPDAPAPAEVRTMSRSEARDAAMRVIEDAPDYLVSDRSKAHVEKLIATRSGDLDGNVIAKRLLVTENDDYRSGFVKAVTQTTPVFTPEEARALNEFRAMSNTDAAGGYGVPVLIDPTIILSSGAADVPVLSVCRIETITNEEWKGVSSAAAAWSTDGEVAAVSDDSVTLAQPTVPVYNARAFIPYSIQIGMDYPGFAEEMAALLDQGYLDYLAIKTSSGSGSSDLTGIFTALDANTNVEVTPTTDGAFGAVDIDKIWKSLPKRFRRNAHWLMNVDVENEIRGFGSGTATSRFTVDQTAEGISKLNGKGVLIDEYAPEFTGTTGASNIMVLGDFKNYLVAQRAGMTVELVPHVFDVTDNRPTGQRGWFAWARVGADSIVDNGFRLLQNQ